MRPISRRSQKPVGGTAMPRSNRGSSIPATWLARSPALSSDPAWRSSRSASRASTASSMSTAMRASGPTSWKGGCVWSSLRLIMCWKCSSSSTRRVAPPDSPTSGSGSTGRR